MGDSWEDWDDDAVAPPLPAAIKSPDKTKFEDEDAEEEAPAWEGLVPKSEQPKPKISKYDESRGVPAAQDDTPLDDPLAEKLRRQRLVEDADLNAAMELFGGAQQKDLEGFTPKSKSDYEQYAFLISSKYLTPHKSSTHYKLLLKQLLKHACSAMTAQEVKDVETSVAGLRSEKLKEEKAATAGVGKKSSKKATLNVGGGGGGGGGGKSAGLDDYVYADLVDDEYDDFM